MNIMPFFHFVFFSVALATCFFLCEIDACNGHAHAHRTKSNERSSCGSICQSIRRCWLIKSIKMEREKSHVTLCAWCAETLELGLRLRTPLWECMRVCLSAEYVHLGAGRHRRFGILNEPNTNALAEMIFLFSHLSLGVRSSHCVCVWVRLASSVLCVVLYSAPTDRLHNTLIRFFQQQWGSVWLKDANAWLNIFD